MDIKKSSSLFLVVFIFLTNEGSNVSPNLECEIDWMLNEGSCYKLLKNPLPWLDAKKSCENYGGKLSEPDTEHAFEFVTQVMHMSNIERVWLGGRDEGHDGVFVWSSVGTNITSNMWDPDILLNHLTTNCVEVLHNRKHVFKMNIYNNCGATRQYICEKQALQTTIKYLEVQKGDNLTLPCPAEPPLPVDVTSVYWSTPSTANTTKSPMRHLSEGSLENPSLIVNSIRKNDSGVYVCNSNARTGPRMYAYYVNVTEDEDETNFQCKFNGGSVSPYSKYENLTYDELVLKLEPVLQELRRDMRVNKTNLSSQIRKRTSATDNRPSSQAIGCIGIVFIFIFLGVIVIFDVVTLQRFIGIWRI